MAPSPPPEYEEGEELDFSNQAEGSEGSVVSSRETQQLGSGRSPYEGIIPPSPLEEEKRLSPTTERRERWPRGAEFLAAAWAYTLSLHSLWCLPLAILQHGGLPFLLMYLLLLVLLGLPLILLEMFLGQYSALPPARLYRHLSPMLRGLGLAICLQAALRTMLDTAVLMWAGKGMLWILLSQNISTEFFHLNQTQLVPGVSLGEPGSLDWQLVCSLAAVALLLLFLSLPGTLLIGKVCILLVPTAYSILIALVIRSSLHPEGPSAVLSLLWGPQGPDWGPLASGETWLQAAAQVVFSLQLGLGGLTAYASSNKYYHNLVRASLVILLSHVFWVLLTTYLVFSLLGLAYGSDASALRGLHGQLYNVTGEGIWLGLGVFMTDSFPKLNFSWLWAALFLLLVIITGLTSIFGFLRVVSSSLVCTKPSCLPLRALTLLLLLAGLFLADLLFALQGGSQIYHLLATYIASWPALLFSLLTILASFCHGTNYLLKDVGGMSRVRLSHWASSHLSTLLYTVCPLLLAGALSASLYSLHLSSLSPSLAPWGLSLPSPWGIPLAWSLSSIPLLPLLLGLLLHVLLSGRNQSRIKHLRSSLIPTARWYKNEQLDISSPGYGHSSSV